MKQVLLLLSSPLFTPNINLFVNREAPEYDLPLPLEERVAACSPLSLA